MKTLKKLFKNYNEYLITALGIVLFITVMPLLRIIDPTSAPLDGGYLHGIVFLIVCSGIVFGLAWVEMKFTFPILLKYLDDEMEEDISEYDVMAPKVKVSLLVWAFYVVVNTILLVNII